jgi:HAAS
MGDVQGLRRGRSAGDPVRDDEQISSYLRRVRSALRLPREQRRRAVEEIRNHLDAWMCMSLALLVIVVAPF